MIEEQTLRDWERKAQELKPKGFLLAEPTLRLIAAVRDLKQQNLALHQLLRQEERKNKNVSQGVKRNARP